MCGSVIFGRGYISLLADTYVYTSTIAKPSTRTVPGTKSVPPQDPHRRQKQSFQPHLERRRPTGSGEGPLNASTDTPGSPRCDPTAGYAAPGFLRDPRRATGRYAGRGCVFRLPGCRAGGPGQKLESWAGTGAAGQSVAAGWQPANAGFAKRCVGEQGGVGKP